MVAIIDDIPTAILRTILCSCLPSKAILPPDSHDLRITLTHVCARWRYIILSTPAFWTSIVFNPTPRFKNASHLLNLAKLWLSRSQYCPLTLEFSEELIFTLRNGKSPKYRDHFLYGGGAYFHTFHSMISPHITHIRHLTCSLITRTTITAFLRLPSGTFPNLESLGIRFVNEITLCPSLKAFTLDEMAKFTVFLSLPLLKFLKLEICRGSGLRPLPLKFPWGQLRLLDMGRTPISPKTFISLLTRTSMNLVHGSFQVTFPSRRSNGLLSFVNGAHVTMHRMERLRLTLLNPSAEPGLFKLIRLPSLRSLWVEQTDSKGWRINLYASLLKHTTNLECLALSNPPTSTGSMLDVGAKARNRKSSRRSFHPDLALEALFKVIKRVHTVYLSTGIYMQTPLLEKVASGQLLPYLQCLTLSSTSARNVLEFVRKRYEYAAYSMHIPTTSQQHGVTIPRPLVSVCLTHIQIGTGNENGDPRPIFSQLCRQCVGTRIIIKILNVNVNAANGPVLTLFDSNAI